MGPNNKQRSRKQYVKYRLSVLRDLHVLPPPKEIIERMLDEEQMSEISVDAIFLQCIHDADWDNM